MKLRNTW